MEQEPSLKYKITVGTIIAIVASYFIFSDPNFKWSTLFITALILALVVLVYRLVFIHLPNYFFRNKSIPILPFIAGGIAGLFIIVLI